MVFESSDQLPEANLDILSYCIDASKAKDEDKVLVNAENVQDYITLGYLKSLIRQVAAGLCAFGVHDGDCVSWLSGNDIRQPALWFGCIATGAVFSPISTLLKRAELGNALEQNGSKFAIVSLEFLDLFIEATSLEKDKIMLFEPNIDSVFIVTKHGKFFNWPWLLTQGEITWTGITDPKVLATKPHSRLFTSGTTGIPKVAQCSHASTLSTLRLREHADRRKDYEISLLHCQTMSHISAQFQITYSLRQGATLYLMSYDPRNVIEKVHFFQITDIFISTNATVDILGAVGAEELEHKLRSVRDLFVGGAMAQTAAFIQIAGYLHPKGRLRPAYGSTEAGLVTFMDYHGEAQDFSHGSVGTVAAGAKVKLTDPTEASKEITSFDTNGVISCKSSCRFIDYYNNPTATSETIDSEDFLILGDIGYISSKNNQWYVVGRSKEIFKVKYEHVAPVEIEQCISDVSGVKEAAVMPVMVEGEPWPKIKALVVPNESTNGGSEDLKEKVIHHVGIELADYKAITGGVEFVEGLPRNSIGKLMRGRLCGSESE